MKTRILPVFGLSVCLGLFFSAGRARPDGELEWAKQARGEPGDYGTGLAVAAFPDGSSSAAGEFTGTAVFGPGELNQTELTAGSPGPGGVEDIFIARYNPDGTLIWAKRAGGADEAVGAGVAPGPEGSTLVTGWFQQTAIFGGGDPREFVLEAKRDRDIFIVRYDGDGVVHWAKRAGGLEECMGRSISSWGEGDSVITGWFYGTAYFGEGEPQFTTLVSAGDNDIFIAAYDPYGVLSWARRAGGPGMSGGQGIAAGGDGSSVITGAFAGAAVFGEGEAAETTLTAAGTADVFIAAYEPDGSLRWARRAGGTGSAAGYGAASHPNGSSVITGWFTGSAVFGEGEAQETTLTAAGEGANIFVAAYHGNGTLKWARRAGGTDNSGGSAVAAYGTGSCLVAGGFWGEAVFGEGEAAETTLVSGGEADIFIAAYGPDGSLIRAKRAGGPGDSTGYGVASQSDGRGVVTGNFRETAVFGEGEAQETTLTAGGTADVFIAGYSGSPEPVPEIFRLVVAGKDYDGDGRDDTAAWLGATGKWYVDLGPAARPRVFYFGRENDIPAPGDYNGDGTTDPTVFRPSSGLWAVRGVTRAYFGREGDLPIPGRMTTDDPALIAVFRPATGLWAVRGTDIRTYFGAPGDYPVPGDYDGDGSTDAVIFRPSAGLWAVRGATRVYYGRSGDYPQPGDYSGNGTVEPAIYRPGSGLWAVRGVTRSYWGSGGYIPVSW